jgi:hypothetical protein
MPTLTVNPQTGGGGSNVTCDGLLLIDTYPTGDTFANKINASTGTAAPVTGTNDIFCRLATNTNTNQFTSVDRSIFTFDTSSIGSSATISSATFSLWGTGANSAIADSIGVVSASPGANNTLATSDYARSHHGTTDFATRIPFASWATAGYNNFALNASGLAAINKTGVTGLCAITGSDIDGTAVGWASNVNADVAGNYADNGTNIPKLVITYSTTPVVADDHTVYTHHVPIVFQEVRIS